MREFFRPSRRKIGVVTLVMACFLAVGLLRTSAIRDRLHTKIGNTHYCAVSNDTVLRLTRYTARDPAPPVIWQSQLVGSFELRDVVDEVPVNWNWHLLWYGFEFGTGDFRNATVPLAVASVPYWFGIPVSLISAYLLLSKPRPARTTPIASLAPTNPDPG